MSRAKEITKSSASLFSSQVLISVISILFLALFARVFTKEQMALLAFTEILTEWMQLIGSLGLGTLAIKDVAILDARGENKKEKQLISSVIVYRILSFFIISVALYIASPVLTELIFDTNEYTPIVKFLVCIGFVVSVQVALAEIQVATQRFHSKSAIHVGIVLGQRIFCVIGFFTFGVEGFFLGFFTASLIGTAITLFDVRKYLTIRILSFLTVFRKSRNYMGLDMLRGTMTQIDKPIIAFFLGAESLAGFHVVKRIYDNVFYLLSAVVVPTGVKFGEVKVEGIKVIRNYFRQSISFISSFFIPLGFLLIVISSPVIILYAGDKYLSDIPIAAAFGFTLIGAAIWLIIKEAALRLISAFQLMFQYIVSSVVTLVGYVILLPILGAITVPIVTGLAYLCGIIPTVYFLKKYYRISMPYKDLLYATICGFFILLLFIPAFAIINHVIQIMIILASSALIYFVWLFFWGPTEARLLLKRAYLNIPFIH